MDVPVDAGKEAELTSGSLAKLIGADPVYGKLRCGMCHINLF